MRRDEAYVAEILDSVDRILRYTDGYSRSEFLGDQKTIDAVVRNFEIIGEATKNISEDCREENPEIPWSKMARMRDQLIHAYHSVDPDIVWTTAEEEIPELKDKIEELEV